MIQKMLRVAMVIGALLVVGLITTLIVRECQADNNQETIEVVNE
jgi:hypothetical protein